jgi:hypothetical protein
VSREQITVYVVIRLDSGMSELSNAVAVTKVFNSQDSAAAEVKRLNATKSSPDAVYELRVTRLYA